MQAKHASLACKLVPVSANFYLPQKYFAIFCPSDRFCLIWCCDCKEGLKLVWTGFKALRWV